VRRQGTERADRAAGTKSYLSVLRDARNFAYLVAMLMNAAVYVQYLSTLPLAMKAARLETLWYGAVVALNGARDVRRRLRARPGGGVFLWVHVGSSAWGIGDLGAGAYPRVAGNLAVTPLAVIGAAEQAERDIPASGGKRAVHPQHAERFCQAGEMQSA
jgi:hypothetical protein